MELKSKDFLSAVFKFKPIGADSNFCGFLQDFRQLKFFYLKERRVDLKLYSVEFLVLSANGGSGLWPTKNFWSALGIDITVS